MGSWLQYGLGTENQNLPGFVVMCPGKPVVGPALWSNSFLPGIYQGCHIQNLDPKRVIEHIRNANVGSGDSREVLIILRVDHVRDVGGGHVQCFRARSYLHCLCDSAYRKNDVVPHSFGTGQ